MCEIKPKNRSERTIQDYVIQGYTLHQTNLKSPNGRRIYTHLSIQHAVTKIKSNLYQESYLMEKLLCSNIYYFLVTSTEALRRIQILKKTRVI